MSERATRAPYETFIRTRAAGRRNVPCGRSTLAFFSASLRDLKFRPQQRAPLLVQLPPRSNTYSSVPERKG
eukprot:22004-Alexandrium_andersonii.AAC.1